MMPPTRRIAYLPHLVAVLAVQGCGADKAAAPNDASEKSAPADSGAPREEAGTNAPDAPFTQTDAAPSACVPDQSKATLVRLPVDLILIVDTSKSSMSAASSSVETHINQNLAAVLDSANIDYRVILLAAYGDGAAMCIGPPLGGASCSPLPKTPANTTRFYHYAGDTGSGELLASILDWYSSPDPYKLAPNGYSQWLRPGARKVFLAFSDTSFDSYVSAEQFDSRLLALSPETFGTSSARSYVFHSIVGLRENSPATAPWLPADPLVNRVCSGYEGYLGTGAEEQKVSILSGGLRFPICQFGAFDVVFNQIAESVVKATPISCDLPFPQPPQPPNGKSLDPNTIQLDYHPGSGGALQTFKQVVDSSKCAASSFYVEGTSIHLCPQACSTVEADTSGSIDVRYGCDVGFMK